MSLYQKYRPQGFDSLVGQNFVREAISHALVEGRTVGAYLFHGSRGTGKTTVARIFAKAVNCEHLEADGSPCGKCGPCVAFGDGTMVDVIEIDAASNNSVDHVRDLIERARFQPTVGKFKIYIVDEVHMLSKSAFNALLKTLEEPPDHVKFVLATTEANKLPETIVSRTQRYEFRRIPEKDIADRLRFVAKSENIDAEEGAILRISKVARGGLRDALTLFEQFVLKGKVTKTNVESQLGLVGEEFLLELESAVLNGDSAKIFSLTEELRIRSADPMKFADELLAYLRDRIVSVGVRSEVFPFLSAFFESVSEFYVRAKFTPDPMIVIEAAIARVASPSKPVIAQPYVPAAPIAPVASSTPLAASAPVRPPAAPARQTAPESSPFDDAPLPDDPFGPATTTKPDYSDFSSPEFETPASRVGQVLPAAAKLVTEVPVSPKVEKNPEAAEVQMPSEKAPESEKREIPSFSVASLVALVRETPRSAALVMALKNAKRCAFEDAETFVIVPGNSLEAGTLAKPDSKAVIVEALEKLSGFAPTLKIPA